MLKLELVLPCYNEGKGLRNLVERAVAAAQQAGHTPQTFQLVLVENGSKDDSFQVMQQLKATELGAWFRVIRVEVNQGYGFGLWSGLKTLSAEYAAWSHADLQCDPADVFKGLKIIEERKDPNLLVKGERYGRNWKDVMVSRVFEFLALLILGLRVREMNAQPKVFHRSLLQEPGMSPPKTFAFDLYMLYRAQKKGMRFTTIKVEFPPRIHGVSNWASNFIGRYKTILGIIRYMFDLSRREGRI